MGKKLDGKKCAAHCYESLQQEVAQLKERGIQPKLVVLIVGNDAASHIYVRNKEKAAQRVGILSETLYLDENITEAELLAYIEKYNKETSCHGLLVQTPLPSHLCQERILAAIAPEKDVDGFHPLNVGQLSLGKTCSYPCTPLGIMELLHYYNIPVQGKHAVIVGRSNIVGKPMAQMLLAANATVTVCHSKTKNIQQHLKAADLIVMAIGQNKWLQKEWIKEEVCLIDVGMNRSEEGLSGDIDPIAYEKAAYYTPVPGGVGPMTIAMLMTQTVRLAKAAERKA